MTATLLSPHQGAARLARRWQFVSRPVVIVSLVYLVGVVIASVVLPAVRPFGPNTQDLHHILRAPIFGHGWTWASPLGTDELGRDVLTRALAGARTSLLVGGVAAVIAGLFGSLLGLIAGYRGGWIDHVIQAAIEVEVSFPGLLLAILFLALVGANAIALIAFLSAAGWMIFARTARAAALNEKQQEYVQSARVIGAGELRVMFRHIAPNLVPSLVVVAALECAQNMLAEASLSFVGLGIQPPAVSWGLMIAEGQNYLTVAPWLAIVPGVMLILSVLAVMTLSEGLRRRIEQDE